VKHSGSPRRLHWGLAPFVPLFRNPHLATIAAHFWPAGLDERRFPVVRRVIETEPGVRVLVESQTPAGEPRGHVILVHGLEGSSASGYMKSMARAALEAGFAAHRFNLRSCGGCEASSRTGYHAGLTCDLRAFLGVLGAPAFLVGFSLGGNVTLKLAGELGEGAAGLVSGVCAVSTPIDLAACVGRLEEPRNRFYELRFLRRLKARTRRLTPQLNLEGLRTLRAFDDRVTAPAFGFRDAEEYYRTQSARCFLDRIRVPVLFVQAENDPVIPFETFAGLANVLATSHGGHIGFLARRSPRCWADAAVVEWIQGLSPWDR
jgi:uncharacterized protein